MLQSSQISLLHFNHTSMKHESKQQRELVKKCAWCHETLSDDQECFALSTRVRPENREDVRGKEGTVIVMDLPGGDRQLLAMVTTADSPARAKGYDLIFQVCSEACAKDLDRRRKNDWRMIDE